jgi:phospholipase/carboxylesterase
MRAMHLSIEWLSPVQPAPQLLILLHGRGGSGAEMRPLAIALREAFPQAAILAPDAPAATAVGAAGAGRTWFEAGADLDGGDRAPQRGADASAAGDAVDAEEDTEAAGLRAAVAGALPALRDWVAAQQARLGVVPQATALAGLGQGATLSLALACAADGLAGRVLAFGGRFADLPATAPELTTLHLLHGADDAQTPVRHARRALTHLGAIRGDATLDIADGIGHGLHPALIDSALFRLRNHIPHRTWRAALGAVPHPAAAPAPGPAASH